MFTLPPRPPKDYVIKEVPKTQQSSDVFTPFNPKRITQPHLGMFPYPVDYDDKEVPEKTIEPINNTVLDKWTANERAWWVTSPGKDAYFLHDICKNYSVVVDDNYDPRYKANERVFNRSFKYELDCIEGARLERLQDKCDREAQEQEEFIRSLERIEKAKEKPPFKIIPCKAEAPFWWEPGQKEMLTLSSFRIKENEITPKPETSTYRAEYQQWQEAPNLLHIVQTDPCKRRNDMLLVGQRFKSEACNWYYKNYPPPDIKFRPKRFV